jgi:WD40 repeat protein
MYSSIFLESELYWGLSQAPIYSLCFSVEGQFLASAGADSRVLLWDLAHGHLLAELTGHKGPIHCLAFSRDGHILTSGNSKMKCRDKPKPLAFSGHLYSKVKDECKHWMHLDEILNLSHKYFITSLCLPGHYHDQSKMGVARVTELLAGIRV